MGKNKKLVIFGNATDAELADYYFQHDSQYEVIAFTVDQAYAKETVFWGRPVVPFETIERVFSPNDVDCFVAIGYSNLNRTRRQKYDEVKAKGFNLASYGDL